MVCEAMPTAMTNSGAATVTAEVLAALLGVALSTLYAAVRDESFPIPPIRVGRRLVWSKARIAALLGVDSLESPDYQSGGAHKEAGQDGCVNGMSSAGGANSGTQTATGDAPDTIRVRTG
jgi:predicted DNA-binding transcriptional regulator AlpA